MTQPSAPEIISWVDQVDLLGEGPLWSASEQALYWVDIHAPAVRRRSREGVLTSWAVPSSVGCLGFTADAELLVAVREGIARLDTGTGDLRFIAHPAFSAPAHRFNDGAVDARGRLWVGSMPDSEDTPTGLLHVVSEGEATRVAETGLTISNGIDWSPDGTTMYLIDSGPGVVYAYDFDLEAGLLSNRRVLIGPESGRGIHDGLRVDDEGAIWTAQWDGGCLLRYTPHGRLDRVVQVPVSRPTCLAFGGPGRDIAYVTSASRGLSADQRAREPWAGHVLQITGLEVRGRAPGVFGERTGL